MHISAVAVFEEKDVVSDQQCIDQTAFQPVVHLYSTSLRLVQLPTPLASYTTAFTSPGFANKYTTANTAISGVCLQLVHFHSPTLSRGKERVRVGKKESEKGRTDEDREGAFVKEREGLWGVFLSWREIAL